MKKILLIAFNFKVIIFLTVILICLMSFNAVAQNQTIQDSLKSIENGLVMNAYQTLSDEGKDHEYGWICESIVPLIPEGRKALLTLIKYERFDLIKALLNTPRIEVQLYALDGLIYQSERSKNFLSSEISSKLHVLKKENISVNTCPGLFKLPRNGSYTARTIILSMTYKERVESIDYLLSEPFVRKPLKLEPINGNW